MEMTGTLIPRHLAQVQWDRVFVLHTRRYAPDYLTAAEADRLPWVSFRDAVPSLYGGSLSIAGLEAIVVAKSLTWSDQDVNVYLGSSSPRALKSYLDLPATAFVATFGWHIELARRVSESLGRDVYVTHGFNPDDRSPDAHSVTAKFHTHLHVPNTSQRYRVGMSQLSNFERLALIEPYSVVFGDFTSWFLRDRAASRWRLVTGFGFFSLETSLAHPPLREMHVLHKLLTAMHHKYQELVTVFTDGTCERDTGCDRYLPRPLPDRERVLSGFVAANHAWLSTDSVALLGYLARHIVVAAARDYPRSIRISRAAQVWIAKGLSGALNFVVSAAHDTLRCDLAPRIISTSGATKVISTDPTLIRKDRGEASAAQQRRMAAFQATVVAAARTLPSPAVITERSAPSTSSSPAPLVLSE
jgi:hypothetical protein